MPSQPSAPLRPIQSKKKRWWKVFKRWKDGEESDWWFASTGIPLMAATLGPLANVSSIAALVTSWRQRNVVDGVRVPDFEGVAFADPRWCYWINVASLICGFLGNLFLLLNFTQRIRCMDIYVPPNRPDEGCKFLILVS
jgi:potassium channel subfamily K